MSVCWGLSIGGFIFFNLLLKVDPYYLLPKYECATCLML